MKRALIVSLTFNFIIILFLIIKRTYYSGHPIAGNRTEWSTAWNEQRNDLFSAVSIDSGDIVFVGDSHIERFLLNDFYPGKKIRNRGIGSNTSAQVIERLDIILNTKPSKIFIQIGVNDLAFGYSPKVVYNNIIKICEQTSAYNIPIFINSVLPTRAGDAHLNKDIQDLNNQLRKYCSDKGITYIDVYPYLIKNNELNKEYTIDNSHLNGKGYTIWKAAIDKYL